MLYPENYRAIANALPAVLVQALFFMAPFAMTLMLSFQTTAYYQVVWNWNLSTWGVVFGTGFYWNIMVHTVVMSVTCVLLCLLIGFPVAYALVNRIRSWENHVKILIVFAFLTDSVLKTFGWVLFLDDNGILNWLLNSVGLPNIPSSILFSEAATMIGMVYNLLPFTIFTLYLSLDAIDHDVIRASYDAGAGKFRTFWEVTLPLCKPGIWAGSLLVFVLGLGVFLEPKVLGGGKNPMAAELIRQTFETRINWPLGAALTIVVIFIAVVAILLFTRVYGLKKVDAVK